jgi:hypothetical protein
MKIIFCITLLLATLLLQTVSAKRPGLKGTPTISPWEIGFSSGASIFLTSINPQSNALNKRINYWERGINPGIGLFVVKNFSPSFGVEINWLNTSLTGKWNNKWPSHPISAGRENPLKFNTQINQFDLMMVFNVYQIMLPGENEDRGHLFLKTGIGVSEIKDNKKFYASNIYDRISVALGIGYSFPMSEKAKIQLGSTFRFVNTDNLDGVHVVAYDKNGKMVEFMKIYEIYNYTYLSISYSLGNFKKHR